MAAVSDLAQADSETHPNVPRIAINTIKARIFLHLSAVMSWTQPNANLGRLTLGSHCFHRHMSSPVRLPRFLLQLLGICQVRPAHHRKQSIPTLFYKRSAQSRCADHHKKSVWRRNIPGAVIAGGGAGATIAMQQCSRIERVLTNATPGTLRRSVSERPTLQRQWLRGMCFAEGGFQVRVGA